MYMKNSHHLLVVSHNFLCAYHSLEVPLRISRAKNTSLIDRKNVFFSYIHFGGREAFLCRHISTEKRFIVVQVFWILSHTFISFLFYTTQSVLLLYFYKHFTNCCIAFICVLLSVKRHLQSFNHEHYCCNIRLLWWPVIVTFISHDPGLLDFWHINVP